MEERDGATVGANADRVSFSSKVRSIIYDPKIRGVVYQVALVVFGIFILNAMVENVGRNVEQKLGFDFFDDTVDCDVDGDGDYDYVFNARGDLLEGDAEALSQTALDFDTCDGANFLYEQPGFGIQTSAGTYLVGYVSGKSTVLDVFWVGLTNTIIVAFLGIICATLLGFVMGIFRLSSNVILRSFATVYVEAFRNVPLILQIIILYTVVNEALPSAREGAEPLLAGATLDKGGLRAAFPEMFPGDGMVWIVLAVFLLAWRGLAYWSRMRKDRTGRGFPAFWIAVALLAIVSPLAYWQAGYVAADNAAAWYDADFKSRDRVRDDPRFRDQRARFAFPESARVTEIVECDAVAEGGQPVRVARVEGVTVGGEPMTEVILGRYHEDSAALRDYDVANANCAKPDWIAPVQWELPLKGGLDGFFPGYGFIFPLSMFAVFLALTLYTGAFIAEIVRAGVLAVNKGQSEAAGALGLRASQTRRLVVVPQAMRVIIPPLASQYLNLTKNSSLATVATYPDLVGIFGKTMLNQSGRAIEIVFMTMMVYLTLSLLISMFMNWYNKRIALIER